MSAEVHCVYSNGSNDSKECSQRPYQMEAS